MDKKELKTVMEKEIDLVQGCISRMAQNSFVIKGWTITLIAVALALLPEKFDAKLLCGISIVATTCFWYLDAFYLKMERLYRLKYQWLIANRLETDEYCYDLNPHNSKMRLPKEEKENVSTEKIYLWNLIGNLAFSGSSVLFTLIVLVNLKPCG